MNDAAGPQAELEQLQVQRARLAGRVRPPWWYLPGSTVTLGLVLAVPFTAHYLPALAAWPAVAAIALFWLLQRSMARATGVAVGTRTLRYPSARAAGIALLAVAAAAIVAETVLLGQSLPGAAIAAGILAAVAGAACLQAQLAGIRRDLHSGAGAP